jgi:uncharacterized protein (DUF433 family)
MGEVAFGLGTGIYSPADAARLLGLDRARVRRWVNGYTYYYRYNKVESRRKQPAVIKPDLPAIGKDVALSFVELMELRVVKTLIQKGLSLQHVRTVALLAASHFDTRHPFASQRVFTDGRAVFMHAAQEGTDLIEVDNAIIRQLIAGPIFEPLLDEIEFDEHTSLAAKWWPLGKAVPVLLNPLVAFGAPVIEGTRLRTNIVAGKAEATSAEDAARSYRIHPRAVVAAIAFERQLAAA